MVGLASKLTILGVLTTSSFFAHSGGQVADNVLKSAQPVVKSELHIKETAEILDLSVKQYMRLMNSIVESPHAIAQGPGFKVTEHPAYIESVQLRERGVEVPDVLSREVYNAMIENRKGFANYVGISLDKYDRSVKKYYIVLEAYDSMSAVDNSEDVFAPMDTTAEEDRVVVVPINEDELDDATSGTPTIQL